MSVTDQNESQKVNALFKAIEEGDPVAINKLLESNIDLEQTDHLGQTPLLMAVGLGNIEIANILLKAGASVSCCIAEDLISQGLMWSAISERNAKIVDFLLEHGINVNQRLREDEDETFLIIAALEGDLETVKKLVERGADVNLLSRKNAFALMNAACQGWQEIYEYLAPLTSEELRYVAERELPAGLKYRERKENKLVNELFSGIAKQDPEAVLATIKKGVDINAFSENGNTALNIAANWGFVTIVRVLIEAGANVNLGEEDEGETPLMIAASRSTIVRTKSYIGDIGQLEVMRLLIEAGADVNAKTDDGWTALIYAALAGSLEAVNMLLEADADVNTRTYDGLTALMNAVDSGSIEVVNVLLEAGANINYKNNYQDTALTIAQERSHTEIVQILLEAGAK